MPLASSLGSVSEDAFFKPTWNRAGGPDMGSDRHRGGRGRLARPGQNEIQLREIHNDALGGTLNLIRWGYIEANLVIITASLPCLRSLVLSGFYYMLSSGQRSGSRLYEPGAGAGAGAAVTGYNTLGSHRKTDSPSTQPLPDWLARNRYQYQHQKQSDDGARGDHILGSRSCNSHSHSLEETGTGTGIGIATSGSSQSVGIRKQVEVTVTAHD